MTEPDDRADLPITINQVVAYNLRRARLAKGLKQAELADLLVSITHAPWTATTVSAAEKSYEGGRKRIFSANDLVAFSILLEVPVSYFFIPPERSERGATTFTAGIDESTEGRPYFSTIWFTELLEAIDPFRPSPSFVERMRAIKAEIGQVWEPSQHRQEIPLPASWAAAISARSADLGRELTTEELFDILSDMSAQEDQLAGGWLKRTLVFRDGSVDSGNADGSFSAPILETIELEPSAEEPLLGDHWTLGDGREVLVTGARREPNYAERHVRWDLVVRVIS